VKQFILKNAPDRDNIVRLENNDYRYLVRVRRLAVGEYFNAVLPDGKETLVQILSIDRGALNGKCTDLDTSLSPCEETKESLPPIILYQALPKGDKMDLIVRQAAEGGITEVVPFVSEFSTARRAAAGGGQKFSRWERIIKEARQQSGSKTATSIRRPLTNKNELFQHWKQVTGSGGALGLLFHHCQIAHKGLEQKSLHSYLNNIPQIIAMAVGPEGGFSNSEVSLFLENGFKPITIGDAVLRTETAALYFAAAIKILLLERDSWELKQAKNNA
jgi:16S rRNA (uracil1498-N3)-methyltransferase